MEKKIQYSANIKSHLPRNSNLDVSYPQVLMKAAVGWDVNVQNFKPQEEENGHITKVNSTFQCEN